MTDPAAAPGTDSATEPAPRPAADPGTTGTRFLPTAADTHAFGRDRLAPALRAGDLLVLTGPLGAGKTALVQGIGAGLGVAGAVLSPTFVIARVHRGGRLPLVHVDAYRMASVAEIDDLDLDAELPESVTAVEWGAGLVEQLAAEHLRIELRIAEPPARSPDDAEDSTEPAELPRTALLRAVGPGWDERLPTLLRC